MRQAFSVGDGNTTYVHRDDTRAMLSHIGNNLRIVKHIEDPDRSVETTVIDKLVKEWFDNAQNLVSFDKSLMDKTTYNAGDLDPTTVTRSLSHVNTIH